MNVRDNNLINNQGDIMSNNKYTKYIVYSKENCPACVEAKTLLESKGIPFEVKTLGVDFGLLDMYKIAPRQHKSFPMLSVIKDGEEVYFGGNVKLRELLEGE